MFETRDGNLTDLERRRLQRQAAGLRREGAVVMRRTLLAAVGTCGVLALLTILASDVAWPAIVAVWGVIAAGVGGWTWRQESRSWRARVAQVESALRAGRVHEVRIAAHACAELEEVEDEGACYAFDTGDGSIVFVTGQEFYPSGRFPSSDFSLVHLLGEAGRLVDFRLEIHGRPLAPARTIQAGVKRRLRWPEHLERVQGSLDEVERLLGT